MFVVLKNSHRTQQPSLDFLVKGGVTYLSPGVDANCFKARMGSRKKLG